MIDNNTTKSYRISYGAKSMTSNYNNNNNTTINKTCIVKQTVRHSAATSSSRVGETTNRRTTHIAASTAAAVCNNTSNGNGNGYSNDNNRSKNVLERSLQQLLLSNRCYYNNDMKNTTIIKQQLIPLLLHPTFGSSLYPAIVFGSSLGYASLPKVPTTQWIDYFNTDYNNDNHIVLIEYLQFPKECFWNIIEQKQQRGSNLYKQCKDNTCLVLSGIIPYYYKNNTYSQYIDIYLPYPSFPNDPPIVFVRKRENPKIITGTTWTTETAAPWFSTSTRSNGSTAGSTNGSIVDVDITKDRTGATTYPRSHLSVTKEIFSDMNKQIDLKTGEVYSNYLSDWDSIGTKFNARRCSNTGSTLIGLLQQLSNDFSIQPPVRTVVVAVEEPNDTTNTNTQPTTTTTTTSSSIVNPSPLSTQILAVVANELQQPHENPRNDPKYREGIYIHNKALKSLPIPEQEPDSNQQHHQQKQQQYPLHYDLTGINPTVSPIPPPITATSMCEIYHVVRLNLRLQQSEQYVEEQLTSYRTYKQKLVQQLYHVRMCTNVVDETLIKIHAQQQSYRAIISQLQQQQSVTMSSGRTTGDNNVNIHPRSQSFSHSDYTFSCADMLQRNLLEIVNNNNARQDNVRSRQSSMTEQTDNSDTTLITLKVNVVDEQVILLEAEDSAYQDLIRKTNYAFDNDFISSENYFKLLRKVAKQHFYVRAYKIKIIGKRRISC